MAEAIEFLYQHLSLGTLDVKPPQCYAPLTSVGRIREGREKGSVSVWCHYSLPGLSSYSLLHCPFTSPLAFPGRHNSGSPCGHPWLRKVSLMNARITSCVRQGHTEAPVLRTSLHPQSAPRGMSRKPTS